MEDLPVEVSLGLFLKKTEQMKLIHNSNYHTNKLDILPRSRSIDLKERQTRQSERCRWSQRLATRYRFKTVSCSGR